MAIIDKQELLGLLAGGPVSASQVAEVLGVTRQAVHLHLVGLRDEELVRQVGAGRASRWEAIFARSFTWALGSGSEEDVMWREAKSDLATELDALSAEVVSCLNYGVTEMLNNAIDHSGGSRVELRVTVDGTNVTIAIVDDGIGAFRNVRDHFSLPDVLEAIARIAKGKQTTMPTRHSGQGLFFTSKVVDFFQVEANAAVWKVDNDRGDMAVGPAADRPGTRVLMRTRCASTRRTKDVFDQFTEPDDLRFDRTTIQVSLSDIADDFMSRSEAKRLAAGLEDYSIVVLDFEGVREIGQGFVDELFRVWAKANPDVALRPLNASREVAFMLERGFSTG